MCTDACLLKGLNTPWLCSWVHAGWHVQLERWCCAQAGERGPRLEGGSLGAGSAYRDHHMTTFGASHLALADKLSQADRHMKTAQSPNGLGVY